jgi:VRR-NUC domain
LTTLAVTERDFQKAVTDALTLFCWRWTHFRPARSSKGWRTPLSGASGFPDVVAVRNDRVLYLELKAEDGRLSAEQAEWLTALALAGADVHCWRPSDWDVAVEVLR